MRTWRWTARSDRPADKPRVRKAIEDKDIKLISINQLTKGLPRAAATRSWTRP